MPAFFDVLADFGAESLSWFWLPLALWTVLCLPVSAVLLRRKQSHPFVRYQVLRALLLALPLSLLVALFVEAPNQLPNPLPVASPLVVETEAAPMVIAEAPDARTFVWTWAHTLGLMLSCLMLFAGVQAVRLALHGRALRRYRLTLSGEVPAFLLTAMAQAREEAGVRQPVRVALSEALVVPLTFGWMKPVVVVPRLLLDQPEALRAALLHELAHVRHGDFVWQAIERALLCLFGWHPLFTRLHRHLDRARELARDAEVLARPGISPRRYAELLLHFAAPAPSPVFAVGMAKPENPLNERISAMKNPKDEYVLNQLSRLSLAVGAGMLLMVVSIVACTDITGPEAETLPPPPPAQIKTQDLSDDDVFIIVENPPELIGGIASVQEQLRYPDNARQAGIEGTVFLEFVVDENGDVINPRVVKGIGGGCDEEAVRAVSRVKFKPGMQRGIPVKVRFQLPVKFRLDGSSDTPRLSTTSSNTVHTDLSSSSVIVTGKDLKVSLTRTSEWIRGTVTDAEGNPAVGANFVIIGPNIGAQTDLHGHFSLRFKEIGTFETRAQADRRELQFRITTQESGHLSVQMK